MTACGLLGNTEMPCRFCRNIACLIAAHAQHEISDFGCFRSHGLSAKLSNIDNYSTRYRQHNKSFSTTWLLIAATSTLRLSFDDGTVQTVGDYGLCFPIADLHHNRLMPDAALEAAA